MPKDVQDDERDARLTIRVDPDYLLAIQRAAMELGTNQSALLRNALQEYVEKNERHFSPNLFKFFREWRQNRKRMNML